MIRESRCVILWLLFGVVLVAQHQRLLACAKRRTPNSHGNNKMIQQIAIRERKRGIRMMRICLISRPNAECASLIFGSYILFTHIQRGCAALSSRFASTARDIYQRNTTQSTLRWCLMVIVVSRCVVVTDTQVFALSTSRNQSQKVVCTLFVYDVCVVYVCVCVS